MDKYHSYYATTSPLIVSMPHNGSHIPEDIAVTMTEVGQRSTDTDWHIQRLYQPILDKLGCSWLAATHSRYVVDLNRPEEDETLYPGQDVTGLFPTTSFDREPLYLDGPDTEGRVAGYWRPYHQKLQSLIEETHKTFGFAILWEAHSIKNIVPRFFEGRLPDLNFGTNDGKSMRADWMDFLLEPVQAQSDFDHVVNGRFKGGYITREYADPMKNIFTIQLELSQETYMDQTYPFTFDEAKADQIRPLLHHMLAILGRSRP